MIPAVGGGTASISRRWPWCAAALLLAVAGGCLAPAESSVLRLARERQAGAVHSEHARQEQRLQIARQETADTLAAIGAAKEEAVRHAARLRAVRTDLAFELARLQTAERDLEAARARSLAIEEQLRPLRELEQAVREQERLRTETAQRLALLQHEVDVAGRTAADQEAELQAKLQALQAQLAAAQKFDAALAAALAAAAEVLQTLTPPPAADAPPK